MALGEKIEGNGTSMTVWEILRLKHPYAKPVTLFSIDPTNTLPSEPHPFIYEEITGALIQSDA